MGHLSNDGTKTADPIASTSALASSDTEERPETGKPSNNYREEKSCIICFDLPQKYGLLENCAHVFCMNCIRDWRGHKGKNYDQISGGALVRCPACRTLSNFVVPSPFWVDTGEGKLKLIANYKKRLSQIPCRHFQESDPDSRYCPFGNDCFYAHRHADGTEQSFKHGIAEHQARMQREREERQREEELRELEFLRTAGFLEGSEHASIWELFVDSDTNSSRSEANEDESEDAEGNDDGDDENDVDDEIADTEDCQPGALTASVIQRSRSVISTDGDQHRRPSPSRSRSASPPRSHFLRSTRSSRESRGT